MPHLLSRIVLSLAEKLAVLRDHDLKSGCVIVADTPMKYGDTSCIVPVIQLQQLANAEQIAGLISKSMTSCPREVPKRVLYLIFAPTSNTSDEDGSKRSP
jgi:hypothetical protein